MDIPVEMVMRQLQMEAVNNPDLKREIKLAAARAENELLQQQIASLLADAATAEQKDNVVELHPEKKEEGSDDDDTPAAE